jgi:acyl transferase domain-containing protein
MAALREFGIDALPANINAPQQTVIGGSVEEIDKAVAKLPSKRISARKLAVSAAFHTPALAEVAKVLGQHLAATPFSPPRRLVFSNTTSEVYPRDPDEMRQLLTRHLIEPVRFQEQILRMYERGARVFIEAGPGSILTNLTTRILEDRPCTSLVAAPSGQNGWQAWGTLLARLFALGLSVRLERWFQYRRLPTHGLAEFVRREQAKQVRRPTDWIVNSSRATPVSGIDQRRPPPRATATPAAAVAEAPPVAAAAGAGETNGDGPPSPPSPGAMPASAPPSRPTTAPPRHAPDPSRRGRPQPVHASPRIPHSRFGTSAVTKTQQNLSTRAHRDELVPARASVLSEHNQVMSQWLELQLRQVQANERFLEAHERIAMACLSGPEELPSLTASQGRLRLAPPPAPAAPGENAALEQPRAALPPAPARAPLSAVRTLPARRVLPATSRSAPAASPPQNGDGAPATAPAAARPRPPAGPTPSASGAAAAAPAAAVGAAATALAPPPTDEFRQDLLQAVAERTGYPPEMLKPDALLEADLGIDSIKTVEIFSSLTKYHQFMPGSGGVDEEVLSEFAKLKTLNDIVAMYDRSRQTLGRPAPPPEAAAPAPSPAPNDATAPSAGAAARLAPPADEPTLERLEVAAVAAPADDAEKKNSLAATSS